MAVLDTEGSLRTEQWSTATMLPNLQAAVGGLIDVVTLDEDLTMYVHDEGLFECEPNPWATAVAVVHHRHDVVIHGPVVLVGGVNAEGYDLPLSTQRLAVVELIVRLMSVESGDETDVVTRLQRAIERELRQ